MIRNIRFAELRPEPWRNGGGSTVEVARSGATDDFDWRISIATISANGPFSVIAGVDRCLVVLDGSVVLACGDAAPVRLDALTAPFHFDGSANTEATLPDGPATVLNIMTRHEGQPVVVWYDGDMASGESGTFCFLNMTVTWTMAADGQDGTAPASIASANGIWVKLPNS